MQNEGATGQAMPQVWAETLGGLIHPLIWIEGDPGVPNDQITDAFAGLDTETAGACRLLMENAKSIGKAQLSANVLTRDSPHRFGDTNRQRRAMAEAGHNVARSFQRAQRAAMRAIGPILDRLADGTLGLAEAQRQSADQWRRSYERVREIGRAASGISRMGVDDSYYREEETWFRSAVRQELRYWHRFLTEVHQGMDEQTRLERFERYLNALRFMLEASRVQAVPDNVLLYWSGPEDERNCKGCEYLLERSPYTKDTLPATPRDGSTQCLTNCRHVIVVRVPRDANAPIRRRQVLEARRLGVRNLKRLLPERMRQRGPAVGGRAQNPFQGDQITAPPTPQPFTRRGRRVRVTPDGFVRESVDESSVPIGPGAKSTKEIRNRIVSALATIAEHPTWVGLPTAGMLGPVIRGLRGRAAEREWTRRRHTPEEIVAMGRELAAEAGIALPPGLAEAEGNPANKARKMAKIQRKAKEKKADAAAKHAEKQAKIDADAQEKLRDAALDASVQSEGFFDLFRRKGDWTPPPPTEKDKTNAVQIGHKLSYDGVDHSVDYANATVTLGSGVDWSRAVDAFRLNRSFPTMREHTKTAPTKARGMEMRVWVPLGMRTAPAFLKLRAPNNRKGATLIVRDVTEWEIKESAVDSLRPPPGSLLEKAILRVRSFEKDGGEWNHVVTHDFVGDDKAQARAFSKAHQKTDEFYGATGQDGTGKLGDLELKAESEWLGDVDEGRETVRADTYEGPRTVSVDVPRGWERTPTPRAVGFGMPTWRRGRVTAALKVSPFEGGDRFLLFVHRRGPERPDLRDDLMDRIFGTNFMSLKQVEDYVKKNKPDLFTWVGERVEELRFSPVPPEEPGEEPASNPRREEDDLSGPGVDHDPGLEVAAQRAGFPDAETAQQAIAQARHLHRVNKMSKRVRDQLSPPSDTRKDGRMTLADRIAAARAIVGEGITEGVTSSWDAVPYSNMRLQDVARLFASASRKKPPNAAILRKLTERLLGTLEHTAMSVMGRAEVDRFSNLMRGALDELLASGALRESAEGCALEAALTRLDNRISPGYVPAMNETIASTQVLKWLNARTRKTKGMLNVNVLQQALEAVGWTVEETTVSVPIKDIGWDSPIPKLLPDWWATWKKDVDGSSDGVKGPHVFWVRGPSHGGPENAPEIAKDAYEAFVKLITPTTVKGTKGPKNPERGAVYLSKPKLNMQGKWDREASPNKFGWEGRGWYGAPGYRITNPRGESFVLGVRVEDDPTSMKANKFWTWAYKSGLDTDAKDYLDNADPEEVSNTLRPASERTLENTGTCPVCFRNVKLGQKGKYKDKIVDHGYECPWHTGGRTGSCWGVGWPPFELSKSGTEAYVKQVLKPRLETVLAWIKRLTTKPKLRREVRRNQFEEIESDHQDYPSLHRRRTRDADYEKRGLEDAINQMNTHISNWKLDLLPYEKRQAEIARKREQIAKRKAARG